MRIRLSIFAIVLVVAVNALVLAGVAWNRSGEPTAVLELTERELAMPYRHWSRRESTGVALPIHRAEQDYDWLDRGKLAELGFDVDRFERRSRDHWRAAERRVHVVLEYDGPAFRQLLSEQEAHLEMLRKGLEAGESNRQQVEAAEARLERLARAGSRLVVVDAGRAAEPLRERYPDRNRYVVMQALVRMHAVTRPEDGSQPQLRGRVGSFLPGRVHVPRRFHAALRRATVESRNDYDEPPRYRAVVKFGRRLEPWLAGIEPMPAAGDSD